MRSPYKLLVCTLLVSFILPNKICAQLCKGSLGDPVVNITFGSGNNPGASLGASTSYPYVSDGCPNDGYYTVSNYVGNCFGDTWFSTGDHTPGDGSKGYMMVVNASYNPGDFFVKKVDGLCPNTTYEFAAWIYNLTASFACSGNAIKPNITFSIETPSGTVLKSYSTGDIPQNQGWKQYGFFFATTVDISSVVLRMTNNAPGGCGNDIALDDITFRACGPLVSAAINGSGDSADVCTGDTSVFTIHADVSPGYSDPAYQWQQSTDGGNNFTNISGATDSVYRRLATNAIGRYLYRLAVSQRQNLGVSSCSIYSNVVAVGVNKYPVINASTVGHCLGDTLFLKASEGYLFSWKGPAGFSSTEQNPFIPVASEINNGEYYVTATSDKGCASNDSALATLTTPPEINAGNDREICEGSSVQLQSTGSNFITSYQWLPPTGLSDPSIPNPVASPSETTVYTLQAAHDQCIVADSLVITVNKNPFADAGQDKVIIKGQSTTLQGTAGGTDVNYLWTPAVNISGSSSLNPVVNPSTNQIYVLNVFSNKGCPTARDSVLVKVYQQLYIPNAFTPNGDGINDKWVIEPLQAFPGAEVQVYNRYGQKVFDNNGKNIWWDGTFNGMPQDAGAYVYLVDLKNNTQVIKGMVYIIK
ncbi:MAG: gliding motility-associated C-terminal domain-containing protein [Ginsengibacter sp.]